LETPWLAPYPARHSEPHLTSSSIQTFKKEAPRRKFEK
jgi:hypothetical protein